MNESRLRPKTVVALCLTEFCLLAALAVPHVVGLPLRVREIHSDLSFEARLSWVEAVAVLSALIANPVVGWLSDRSVRRIGHRTRWIMGGVLLGCLATVASTFASNLPELVLVWACAQTCFAAVFAALYGTLSDIVSPSDRAQVASWFAAAAIGAIAFGGLLAATMLAGRLSAATSEPRVVFVVMAVVAVPVTVASAVHLRAVSAETRPRSINEASSVRAADHQALRTVVRSVAAAGAPYWWLWLQRLFAQAAYGCFAVYGVFFLTRRTGMETKDAAILVATVTAAGAIVGMVVAALVARALVERWGYRPVMLAGLTLLMSAGLILTVTTDVQVFVVAHLCAGAGLGLYFALDLAVLLAVLPADVGGRFLGYFHVARALPGFIVPALGPVLLAIGSGDLVGADRSRNYFALMIFGCGLALVALVLTSRLVLPDVPARVSTYPTERLRSRQDPLPEGGTLGFERHLTTGSGRPRLARLMQPRSPCTGTGRTRGRS